MFRKLLFLLVLAGATLQLHAQVVSQNIYSTVYNDVMYDFLVDEDGSMMFLGNINELGTTQAEMVLLKTDPDGNVLWGKTYGGEDDDIGVQIVNAASGNYLLVGNSYSFGQTQGDVYLVYIDEEGNLLWSTVSNIGVWIYTHYAAYDEATGDFILAGTANSPDGYGKDAFFARVDSTGKFLWFKTYSTGIDNDWGYGMQELDNGDFLLYGRFNHTYDYSQGGLIRINADGEVVWARTYNTMGYGLLRCAVQTTDGDILTAGRMDAEGMGDYALVLIKIDENGYPIWSKKYGGSNFDFGVRMKLMENGDIVINGTSDSFGSGDRDIFLLKTDEDGNVIWGKAYGGTETDTHHGFVDFQVIENEGFRIQGCSKSFTNGSSDFYLLKADSDGTTGCYEVAFSPEVTDYIPDVNSPYIITDKLPTGNANTVVNDITFLREELCSDTLTFANELFFNDPKIPFLICPNPADQSTTLFFKQDGQAFLCDVTNLAGEKIMEFMVDNQTEINVNTEELMPGIYMVNVYDLSGSKIQSKKLIKQ